VLLQTRSGPLGLDRAVVIGVLNATPDSFYPEGRHADPGAAAAAAVEMVAGGAGMLDLGAESSRPGAQPVPVEEELGRLLPVLRAVRRAVRVPLSIDTTKAEVARRALAEGADVINDISAGRFDAELLPLCARERVPVVLMHMQGTPATMQAAPRYTDVVHEVNAFLGERARAAEAVGVPPGAIVLDPGLGFGKTAAESGRLLRRLDLVVGLGYPVLVGVSRKTFIGNLLGGRPAQGRLFGTAAAVALAVSAGARLVRVHDPGPMADVVRVVEGLLES